MKSVKKLLTCFMAFALLVVNLPAKGKKTQKEWRDSSIPSFYETYKDQFDYVGLAVSYGNFGIKKIGTNKYTAEYQHDKSWGTPMELYYPEVRQGVKKHSNTVTVGNELKPQFLFAWWSDKDGGKQKLVDFTASNGKTIKVPASLNNEKIIYAVLNNCKDMNVKVRGHVLTWHLQTPDDFFAVDYKAETKDSLLTNPVDKETLTARHEWYIKTVLECVAAWEKENSYGEGNHLIWAWDVVNEACADDASDSLWLRGSTPKTKNKEPNEEGSRWFQIYGDEEYIVNAFRFANAYAPSDVKLCYNDYNEYAQGKTQGICRLIKKIQAGDAQIINGKSVKPRIDVMGMQSHVGTTWPGVSNYEKALKQFLDLGLDVHVTELDFSAATQEGAEKAYKDYFEMLQKYGKNSSGKNKVECVTIWGLDNEDSWINPNSNGQKTYPLLFTKVNNEYIPNDSFWAVINSHENALAEAFESESIEGKSTEAEVKSTEGYEFATTWASAQYQAEPSNQPPLPLSNNSIRQVIHTSLGGDLIRVKFSNACGEADLKIKEAHIARSVSDSKIDLSSDTCIYFKGKASCTIPAGQEIWSDPISLKYNALDCLTVTTYFGSLPKNITGHMGSRTKSYILKGKHLSDEAFVSSNNCEHWYVLAAIDVFSPKETKIISCYGDSITDGRGSTTDRQNRWTDILSQRLLKNADTKNVAAINEGIGGTCVSSSGVNRFATDVLNLDGAYYAFILYGINDIIYLNASSDKVINTYKKLIKKAHAKNIIVYGGTLLPFGNCNDFNDKRNAVRLEVNEWIRNTSNKDGGFDAYIDFAKIMASSSNPDVMNAAYDSGDGLHPNAEGYKIMGNSFDLDMFTKSTEDYASAWEMGADDIPTIVNQECFKYALPEKLPSGTKIRINVKGVNNSSTLGFRIWFTDDSGSDKSNIYAHTQFGEFEIQEDFVTTANVKYLFFKGPRYGVNIESLSIKECSVTINGKTTEFEVADYL